MFIVTGASGHTGGAVADELLNGGHPVRVVLRSEEKGRHWKELGAEVAVADLTDADALGRAFEGGNVLYLMNPTDYMGPDMLDQTRDHLAAVKQALKSSSIKKVVALSSAGAFYESGTGNILCLHLLEKEMSDLNIPVTFIRPPNFMENWASSVEPALNDGVLPAFSHDLDAKYPQIATRDIGKAAAGAMLEDTDGITIKELAGKDYSPNDIAKAFSRFLGKDVTAVAVPESEWMNIFRTFCTEENAAHFFEMTKWFNSGAEIYDQPEQVPSETDIGVVISDLTKEETA